MRDRLAIRGLLADAVARGLAPRLDAAIRHRGQLLELSSHEGPAARFDLASLTKPLATGLIALSLCAEGRLTLGDPAIDGVTARQLLDHSAGYAPWAPLFRASFDDDEARQVFLASRPLPQRSRQQYFASSRARVLAALDAVGPVALPGTRTEYSDLGMLKLGRALERATGKGLNQLFQERVLQPLKLVGELSFAWLGQPTIPEALPTGALRPRPPAPGQEQALAGLPSTELGPTLGEVDDDNAYALGGVAAHAGLFGTARAVALLGARFLEETEGAQRLAPAALALEFCGPSGPGGRGLGWDRPSPTGSSLGTALGRGVKGAVGHLGFTGCSVWIDLDQRAAIALCSNRVFLGRENQLIRDFRPRFHDAVAAALDVA